MSSRYQCFQCGRTVEEGEEHQHLRDATRATYEAVAQKACNHAMRSMLDRMALDGHNLAVFINPKRTLRYRIRSWIALDLFSLGNWIVGLGYRVSP